MPVFSFVIITFNSGTSINLCLSSVFNQDYQDFEAIVVDNGSKDNTVSTIKKNYPRVILIENNKNLGAAKARNQGIAIAKGDWIVTLDCDIILERNFLSEAISFIKELDGSIVMFQPKILKDDKKTIYSCGIYLSSLRRFYDIGQGKLDNGRFNSPKYIFGVCSAAAFYKRPMLEAIKEDTGYFDERFFFLVEDVDLSWRAQKIGWKVAFYPKAVCYHYGSSSQVPKDVRQYFCFRNRYFAIFKNENRLSFIKLVCLSMSYDIPRLFYLLFTNKLTLKALNEIIDFLKFYKKTEKDKRRKEVPSDTFA